MPDPEEELEYVISNEHIGEVKLEGLQERIVDDSVDILTQHIHLPRDIVYDMVIRAILMWQQATNTKIAAVRLMQPGHQFMVMKDLTQNFKLIARKMMRFVGTTEMLDKAMVEVLAHFQENYMNQDFFD